MNACPVKVSIAIIGSGVTKEECEQALGLAGKEDRPRSPEFHSWGWSMVETTDYVANVVEKALRVLDGHEERWNALLDRHSEWRAMCDCALYIKPPPEEMDDYPCITFEPGLLKRLLDARLELGIGFTSKRPG